MIKKIVCMLALAGMSWLTDTASAQITLRLDPETSAPDTSLMPAQFGYADSKAGSGGMAHFAIAYALTKGSAGGNVVYEPYLALAVNDNASTSTDKKSVEVGVKSVIGDIAVGGAWLVDASASRSRDRIATTSSTEASFSAEPVFKWLKYGVGHTSGEWGLFVRPKIEAYGLNTIQTDDPAKAPKGSTQGLSVAVALDFFPAFSDRTRLSFQHVLARDLRASGARSKDDYSKRKLQIGYLFYDPNDPPKGKTLFSLIFARESGRDALSTSTAKKQSTGIYLGVSL